MRILGLKNKVPKAQRSSLGLSFAVAPKFLSKTELGFSRRAQVAPTHKPAIRANQQLVPGGLHDRAEASHSRSEDGIDLDLVGPPRGCYVPTSLCSSNGNREIHNEDRFPSTHWRLATILFGLLPR